MVGVRNRHRQRIGGVGSGDLRARQQPRDHGMDLRLFGIAVADDGFLDQPRRILAHVDPGSRGDHDHNPARLAELERRLRVLVDEHFLDGGAFRPLIREKGLKLVGEVGKPPRQGRRAVSSDLTVGDVTESVPVSLDEAPTRRAKARIETEDFQASFSSSSSETS